MSLKVIILTLTAVMASCFGSFSHAQQQEEGRVLYHVVELDPVILTNARVSGLEDGHHVQVNLSHQATPSGSALSAMVSSGETLVGRTVVDYTSIPNADLSTLELFSRQSDHGMVIAEIRFGTENDCFINDDGRGRLRLLFKRGQPVEQYTISYDTCEPVVRRLK